MVIGIMILCLLLVENIPGPKNQKKVMVELPIRAY